MTQLPMISVPLKATNEIDWITPLKAYIRDTYGDDPDRYTEECAALNRMRQDMRGAGKDSTAGRDLLYRYYGQLELLDLRFPVDEQHIKISFTWFDAFTHKPTSQYSLAFEKASIIFNISAVLSCHGALQSRSEESGLKMSYHAFQAAAGMFAYINENFLHAPSTDLRRDTVKTLINIMLAQAQEVFLERQVVDQKKVGLLAKLSSQAASLYAQALEGVQENVTKAIFEKVWLSVVQVKFYLMSSMAQYYQALADNDANSHGVAIARLKVAESYAKDAHRIANNCPGSMPPSANLTVDCGVILAAQSKRHLSNIQEKSQLLTRENDYLYHDTVPAEDTVSPIAKLAAAKPIPVSDLYAGQDVGRITGPDLFARIIPLAVTEWASLYDEEKAKLVRAETERADLANGEMAASLDYLRLPGALQILKGSFDQDIEPDEEFVTWCDDVAAHENPAALFDVVKKDREHIAAMLDRSTHQLDTEESLCEQMRSKYEGEWSQQASSRLTTTLRSDIRSHREALDEASKNDSLLSLKLRHNQVEFDEMRSAALNGEVDLLFQNALHKIRARSSYDASSPATHGEGHLLDADPEDEEQSVTNQIANVEDILKRLNLVKRERTNVLKDLKEMAHNDDITQVLILNKKSVASFEQHLFQSELEKYQPSQARLVQANHRQLALMKDLNATYNKLLQNKRVRQQQSKFEAIQRQRAAMISKYKKAYQEFLDLEAGLQGAKRWYAQMKETVESVEKNVEAFVNNRRAEGSQLLTQIDQEHANNRAARDMGRTRELLDRMQLEPKSATSSRAASGRPTPAPLSFNNSAANPYTQTANTPGGQFQLPAHSPHFPPTQLSYNPSVHGRIPGPTSPPPTQTTMVIGPRPVTSTPPPNRTSFSPAPPQPFNTYGNPHAPQPPLQPQPQPQPQAQAQPGFVLPPPPPGPPPLGPQQTFHINYANTALQQQPRAQSQAAPSQADPYAGVSSWR